MHRIVRVVCASLLAVFLAAPSTWAGGKASEPFNGKDLSGWKLKGSADKSKWVVGAAEMDPKSPGSLLVAKGAGQLVNGSGKGGVDLYSEEKWGDCRIELEFMVPKGSNSGIYVHGEYEIQILDSYGRAKVGPGDLGGLYGAAAPKVNAARKPGEWQSFVIDFQAPRFENGKKVENAKFLRIQLNDQVIHENITMKGPTPSGVTGREAPTGPIMFQGNHGPVAFRNIKITPK